GAPPAGQVSTGLPFGPLTIRVDALSAFFLIVIGLVSMAAAVYAIGYLGKHVGRRSLRPTLALLNLLLATLIVIVTAADGVLFLIAWETMAFVSYLMVNFEYEDRSVAQAGYLMLAVGELGTIGIVGAILFLANAGGGFGYAALHAGAGQLSPALRDLVLVIALLGFGAKSGLLPLQLWLPEAHPAAPSHISALLSAVIVKMGLYGILRFLVDILGGGPAWWGLLMLALGAATAFVGIIHALVQQDLKRILAYSTIENVGIILAAIGLSLTFRSFNLGAMAAIAGLFALYHLINHAVYKGLLFLGAGSVDYATGTRRLELLGGLLRRMPWTAVCFLVGALAIAAVPPFAGYISEWAILETMLQSFAIPDVVAKLVIAASGALVGLTVAIGAVTFVRAYGIGFLAQPRSEPVDQARETPLTMRLSMGFLALVSLGLGILPAFVITGLNRVSTPLWGTNVLGQVVPPLFGSSPGDYAPLVGLGGGVFRGLPVNGLVIIPAPKLATINSPTYLVLWGLLLLAVLLIVVRLIRPLGPRRKAPVWAGGIPRSTPRMQYSGLAYSNPARLIFHGMYRSVATFRAVSPAARHGAGQIEYSQEVPPPFERSLYRPVLRGLETLGRWAKPIQSGNVNQYVLYIFAIVLVTLIVRAA
ncbi:MAG: hydrogenase 4 subunit B, partial [Chloroflexota bacterium]|nr:hydrogenase 4 subunit B [Chloroflexota bacterium]